MNRIAALDVEKGTLFWSAGDVAWKARWWLATEEPRARGDLVVISVMDERGTRDTVTATPDYPLALEGPPGSEEPPEALLEKGGR